MYTQIVSATTDITNLKALMETAGRSFPRDHDDCLGMIIQIDPASTDTVEVMGLGATAGFVLSTDPLVGPNFIAFRCSQVNHVFLKASAATTVIILVETRR